ncbi:MAG TPA: FHA domain-containing protein [Acidobacteriota bacterium]|nr:FHA domain-containing protein [Acidobacteriota bacterium]
MWKKLVNPLQPGQPEPLEIRNAILDEIEELVQPLGDGRRGLVHNRIVVRLISADPARRGLLAGALAAGEGLKAAARRRLQAKGCSMPADLAIDIRNEENPALTSSQREYELNASIEGGSAAAASPELPLAEPAPPRARPRARLVLLEGDGPVREVEIARDIFNIGRIKEVREKDQRPTRRNDFYFGEAQTSVSRRHAHIRYYPETGEFRIFDDRSARGTRLFSGGEPIDVPSGRGRGEQLHSGDEIYFGSVAVRFEILGGDPA